MDRPEIEFAARTTTGGFERARIATHRFGFPALAVLMLLLFGFSASAGFPDRVEAVGTPLLAAVFLAASADAWRGPGASRAAERWILFACFLVLVAAAFEPVATGRFEIAYAYLLGYAPLAYAASFLFLGPRGGSVAASSVYAGLAAATLAGVATGQIPVVRSLPLVVANPILIGLLYAVAWSMAAAARERVEAQEEAATDPLTGALNRRSGERGIERLAGRYAMLVIDLDAFKRLNDERGHALGDRILSAVVEAIQGSVRPGDLVVRWGGDEFVVVAPDTDDFGAGLLCERLTEAIDAAGERLEAKLGASIGSAVREPEESWRSVFERADREMYAAKEARRGHRSEAAQAGGS